MFAVENGVARRRALEIGRRNDTQAEVLAGIEAGTPIVLHPGERVDDGVEVVPREG
ncbi:MAG: hypothetical protein M5U09_05665 [Gammaproteobacteria bacterium]|nr:hypothetical protein [Gammaproteobacteria bacterium]